jgi:DNA invertase Pin-like site-specific DNA recombinase
MTAFVAYLRVSTAKQGASGLGLEAQRAAVEAFARQQGGQIAAAFVEVESGRKADRPQLAAAIAKARKVKATLLIARLDRLARNVAFVAGLMETGVDFRACDMPTADRFMLHIFAAMAEEEARKIGERTRAALAAAKARGVVLGSPKARETVGKARAARTVYARQIAANVAPIVREIRAAGISSLAGVARALEARGVETPTGRTNWQAGQVARVLAMAA